MISRTMEIKRTVGQTPGRTNVFKLVVLGESSVGKSSLVLRFVKGVFHEHQESTIGAAYLTQNMLVNGAIVKFEIWDTAGQERYHSLAPMYYRGAHAAIVMYDVTDRDTYRRAVEWVKELKEQSPAGIVIALAGNKTDLLGTGGAERRVLADEVQTYADENGLLFMETSAKTSVNVNEIFETIARTVPLDQPNGTTSAAGQGNFRIADRVGRDTKLRNCC